MRKFRTFPKTATPARGRPSRWGLFWYLAKQRRERAAGAGDVDEFAIVTEDGFSIVTETGDAIVTEDAP